MNHKLRLLVYKKLKYECDKNIQDLRENIRNQEFKQEQMRAELKYLNIMIKIKKKQKEIRDLRNRKEKEDIIKNNIKKEDIKKEDKEIKDIIEDNYIIID